MKCSKFLTDLSCYADHELEGEAATRLRQHLRECPACDARLDEMRAVRALVHHRGRVAPPPELELALRVRLSHEVNSHFLERLLVRLQNLMEPVAIPALAGVVSALVLFGILIHTFAMPAVTNDVPLVLLNSPPRLRTMAPLGYSTGEEGLLLQVHVDEEGRILDFRVLNGPQDPVLLNKLRDILLFTRFEPATSFGVPRHGTTILNYRSISVKG